MASFNKVILMGNLTRDPQLKHLANNLVIAEFGLACNRKFRTQAGEDREEVAFVDCAAFGRQAETIGQYCAKGKPLFLEGHLKYDSWDAKDGSGKRSKLTVTVENFQFIGAKPEGEFPSDAFATGGAERPTSRPGRAEQQSRQQGNGRQRPAAEQPFGDNQEFQEADIPF